MLYRLLAISRNLPFKALIHSNAIQWPIEGFMSDQRFEATSSSPLDPAGRTANAPKSSVSASGAQSTIGKTMSIKGEITGSGSVLIEGKVEGSITLPDDRVTIGRDGRVSAHIASQDIVVVGEVVGNCTATDHLCIRSEGSLIGDVVVTRISVEEGACLTGSIDIRRQAAAAPRVEERELVEA
jgi:cytoskeletal protein CcmA (bactofilin family)